MATTWADTANEPPSALTAYVVDASEDNQPPDPRFRFVGDGQALSTAPTTPTTIQLDPLDGSPHYIIVQGIDAHGDNTTDGNRTHTNWPALPRAVRIDTGVTEVWPRESGRVYISDSDPQPQRRYAGVPVLFTYFEGNPRRCQTVDHQANIEALVELTVTNSDQSTSTSATCGGVQVYFRSLDPDSNTLWDQLTDGVDNPNTDDNVDKSVGGGRGTVAPEVSVAAANQSGGDPPTNRAVATTTLAFTDHQAGDNYVVEASTCKVDATPTPWVASGVLTAWKLIYYERDSMFREGSLLATSAAAGESHIHLTTVQADWVGCQVVVFDAAFQTAEAPDQTHSVTSVDTGANTLTVSPALVHPYDVATGAVGIVRATGPRYYETIDTSLLASAFASDAGGQPRAFVDWRPHPGEVARGAFPRVLFNGFAPEYAGYFRRAGQANTVHLIDGWCVAPGNPNADRSGLSLGREVIVLRCLSDGTTEFDHRWWPEVLVHECGHLFLLTDLLSGHPAHENHLRSDGCVMLYRPPGEAGITNNLTNGVAEFGGPVPAIGEPADATQPVDLRNGIAGCADPVPGAPPSP